MEAIILAGGGTILFAPGVSERGRCTLFGEITHLTGRILDTKGNPIKDATIEIWRCDANQVYIHTGDCNQQKGQQDKNFQGVGWFTTGATGEYHFRRIKPVPYPGRPAPHIHFKYAKRPCGGGAAPSKSADVDDLVSRMMAFDQDQSGTLTRAEITDERLHRLFDRADANKDGPITKAELTALAEKAHVEDRGGPRGGPGGPRGTGGPRPGESTRRCSGSDWASPTIHRRSLMSSRRRSIPGSRRSSVTLRGRS
ncbi:MAG: pcaH 3 [Planctomycetota bacterium]|nr:pcaH 3 [Planctomycetota bacterium]